MTTTTARWDAAYPVFASKIKSYARNARRGTNGGEAKGARLSMPQEDIEQELLMVLEKCVRLYNPDNGACFNTYVQHCFQTRLCSLSREQAALKRVAIGGVVSLSVEAVTAAAEQYRARPSAEDEAILLIDVESGRWRDHFRRLAYHADEAIEEERRAGSRSTRSRSRLARSA